ncbi:hypothetical protein MAPG_01190 [Magnaporthiopsis poae ATCC 64411]|uniref:Rhodopsin domain-containing protein n=1 Tax=Magnaporthiopsis poae (strain ATCC 64411 / 73-15) TaxID=644358 RepID=A0A0C4DN18_MAGP6|nr:hypothetical protein MAPG_01190 [Magnaporthiopsis poae ATCC 64411]
MQQMDVLTPVPGPGMTLGTPNAELSHESQQAGLYFCAGFTWLVGGCFVALRFYTRRQVLRILGAADWCILAAWVFATGVMVASVDQIYTGQGRHIWDTDPADLALGIRASWYSILFYSLTVCFVKISILLLYFSFFTIGWAWWTARVIMGFVVVSNVWTIGSVLTACIPLQAFWDAAARNGALCQSEQIWWFNNGLHVATDFFIFALPLPVIWNLRLPWRQRLAVVALFALGFFVCILATVRLVLLVNTTRTPGSDITWNTASNTYWTCIEVNLAIACACGVTLKPLIVRRFPRLFGIDRGAKSVAPTRVPAASHHLSPRIDSWIVFPGKLDGFETYGKEANLDSNESLCYRDIHHPGLAQETQTECVADWESNIGIAVSDEWTEGQLRAEHNRLTIWKEAHPIWNLSKGVS